MEAKVTIYQKARPKLFGLAYRLLGSRMDAEDVIQDAWFKLNSADTAAIRDMEAWLVTVVTRLGIDRLRQLRSRREDYFGPWLPEPVLDGSVASAEQSAELASDLSMAFMVAMERLGAEERAAFLLREVFDYSYAELAGVLGKSEVACRQVVTRARARVRKDRPRFEVSAETHRSVVERFMTALMHGDATAFAGLLAEEVRWVADGGGKAMAATRVICGTRAASRLAVGLSRRFSGQWELTMVPINGQLGVMLKVDGHIRAVMALQTDGHKVLRIFSVVNPDKLQHPG